MRRYLAGPRGKPAAVHSSAAIQRQGPAVRSAVFGKRYFFLDRELRESNDLALSPGERGGLRGAAEDEMDALQ